MSKSLKANLIMKLIGLLLILVYVLLYQKWNVCILLSAMISIKIFIDFGYI